MKLHAVPQHSAALLRCAVGTAALLVSLLSLARAQSDDILAPMGGPGGTPFLARCPAGELLTGLDLWAGEDIDAVRPLCVPAVRGQFQTYPTKFGGPGGSLSQLVCPNDLPIVIGMDIRAEGKEIHTVNNIDLYCGRAVTTPQRFPFPMASFDAPEVERSGPGATVPTDFEEQQRCPPGLVAVGIDGRAHDRWVHAIGLICGAAQPEDDNAVRANARVKLAPNTGALPRPICDLAKDARARNSPAATGLENQCQAQELLGVDALAAKGGGIASQDPLAAELRNLQPEGAARRGFDIGIAAAEGQTAPGPGKQRIHDALSPAEQQGYAAAVSFSLARNRQRLAELSAKGPAITSSDPLAVLLRSQQLDDAARRGFDIGMAAAEGQTAPGPGKQRLHDNLPAAEQSGFAAAVDFSLERNRNAVLAGRGADLARSAPRLAARRNAEADPFYRLGFDVAVGFFAQAANGSVAMLKLRDTLSVPVRRGFDAAVAFNASQK